MTVIALANLIAALVDTMRDCDVANGTVHQFLDRLDHLNAMTLWGEAEAVIAEVVGIVRATVPGND